MVLEEFENDLVVFSKSDCMQCDATYMVLEEKGIDFAVVKVDEDDNALDYIKSQGFLQAPVVIANPKGRFEGYKPWSGFRPDLIANLSH